MAMSFLCQIHNPLKFDMCHFGGLFGEIYVHFEILISPSIMIIEFIMLLNCDMWHNQKLPCDILIEFWKFYIKINIYLSR
jgi:hypothetical protein